MDQALTLYRQVGNTSAVAATLENLGVVAAEHNDFEAASGYFELALKLYRQMGDTSGEAVTLGNLGNLAGTQGDYASAKDYYEKSEALSGKQ